MRLLNVHDLTFHDYFVRQAPPYAIASHRWINGSETTYQEFLGKHSLAKAGYQKVLRFARYVAETCGLDWIWIDTCCINKESSQELSEAINSMFKWYRDAAICLAQLPDVTDYQDLEGFIRSNWFTRGWTLQELLAPKLVIFLSQSWQVIGHKGQAPSLTGSTLELGRPLTGVISSITGISQDVLDDFQQSAGLSPETKRKWMGARQTTRDEDRIYSLLGILNISMTIIYGEGYELAERRLESKLVDRVSTRKRTATGFGLDNIDSFAGTLKRTKYDKHSIRKWLNPVSTRTIRDQLIGSRTAGTCGWILESVAYKSWVREGPSHPILWIHGPAGFGKSVLAASLADHLEKTEQRTVVSFFCSATEDILQNAGNIIRSCAAQALQCPGILELVEAAEAFSMDSIQTGTDIEVFELFCQMCRSEPGLVILIDGFDECHEYQTLLDRRRNVVRGRVLEQLRDAVANTASRLVIVSRDEEDIRHALCNMGCRKSKDTVIEYQIRPNDVHKDIECFSTQQMARSRQLTSCNESVQREVMEHLITKSEGMFMFVSLQSARLAKAGYMSKLRQVMAEIPADLRSFYESDWVRITAGNDQLDRDRALSILAWVTFASKPLTAPALFEAIAIQEDECDFTLSEDLLPWEKVTRDLIQSALIEPCKPFLVFRPGEEESTATRTGVIQLVHFSMKAFLIEKFEEQKVDTTIPWGNQKLARLCIGYLSSGLAWSQLSVLDDDIRGHALGEYVAQYWMIHVRALNDTEYAKVADLLGDFFSSTNKFWKMWRDCYELTYDGPIPSSMDGDTHVSWPWSKGPGDLCYYASYFGLPHLVRRLIEEDSSQVNKIGGRYGTPLQAACKHNWEPAIEILLKHGADVDLQAGPAGTALMAAVFQQNEKLTLNLLKASLNVLGHRGPASYTVFHCAAERDDVQLIKRVIDRHVEIDHRSKGLFCANDSKTPETSKIDFRIAEAVNSPNRFGFTPLHLACVRNNEVLANLLIELGADINTPMVGGWSPLPWACVNGSYELTASLIKHSAKIHIPVSTYGALFAAVSGRIQEDLMVMLLDSYVDKYALEGLPFSQSTIDHHKIDPVNKKDHLGRSWIHIAACLGHCRSIIAAAQYNLYDNYHWTPLHWAAYFEQTEACELLLQLGADITLRDGEGMTAWSIAQSVGNYSLAATLGCPSAEMEFGPFRGTIPKVFCDGCGHVSIRSIWKHGSQ